jgi:hypothetical protein
MAHPALRRLVALACPVLILFAPSIARAQTTALYFDSQAGDYIGQGVERTWTTADLTFTASASTDRSSVSLSAIAAGYSTWWYLNFAAPSGTPLAPGSYENATRAPFQLSNGNGLSVSGSGRGCNRIFGRFDIHEIAFDGNGLLLRFAADFEQHCEGMTPALFGAIRYNSTHATLEPFGGSYPHYGIRLTPAVNGYVSGPGLDCGAGRTDCDESYSAGAVVTLQAVPSPGYVFLGWSGYGCTGADTAAITVRWMMLCAPVFNAAPGQAVAESPDYSSEALFVDGYFGAGAARSKVVYAPPMGAVSVTGSPLNEIRVSGEGLKDSWTLTFAAPPGVALAPGHYGPAATSTVDRGQDPELWISGPLNCQDGGRFTIHELQVTAGVVTSFSADFEAPCGNFTATPLAGSVRFRSSRATLLPFDGAYPASELRLGASLGGYVSGTGIDCGDGGRTDCDETYSPSALVSLEAFPSAGYEFLGWSGRCTGESPVTTVLMDRSNSCLAVFHPVAGGMAAPDPAFATAALVLDSPGSTDQPARRIRLSPDAVVTRSSFFTAVTFRFRTMSSDDDVTLGAPGGRLFPGEYEEATGDSWYGSTHPYLSVGGCSESGPGSFTVYEADYDGAGTLLALAADFEIYCSNTARPYIAGSVRFNSSRSLIRPFDGAYPRRRLSIVSTDYGRVTGPGLDCGNGGMDCVEPFGAVTTAVVEARPAPGYRFLGWTDACNGGAMTSVSVDRVRRCAPVFGAVTPGSLPQDTRLASNAVLIESPPGDVVGGGRRSLILDGTLSAYTWNRSSLDVDLRHTTGSWSFEFEMPTGQTLVPGVYTGAGRTATSTQPGIAIRAPGYCSWRDTETGRFTIYEIGYASATSNTVTALAVDFEYRCTPTSPPLVGSIRFNSSRHELRPFPRAAGSTVPFDLNADGAADLLWQNRADGRLSLWHMSGAAHMLNEPLVPDQVGDTDWHIVGSADANGDGYADLYWQHQTSGALSVWYMRENRLLSGDLLSPSAVPDTDWKVRSVADMDRDGHPDLIWQNVSTGLVSVWFMNGRTLRSGDVIGPGPVADTQWTIVGTGDMNGDGWTDLVWHHTGGGHLAVWFMYAQTMLRGESLSPASVPDTTWRVRGVGDLNVDGTPDLVWQNLSTLDVAVWFMQGLQLMDGRPVIGPRLPSAAWHLVTPR